MKNEKKSNIMGVSSLVVSILGLLLFLMPYFGLPLSILAIIFAYKQNKEEKTGMALSGKIIGIIGIVLNAITLFILVIFLLIASIGGSI